MGTDNHKGERIAKRIARAGLCSRRDAERWIEAGRVRVNGDILKTPAFLVQDKDVVVVDGKPLNDAQDTRLFLYHKPAGLVTTHKDERGRETVFDKLSNIGIFEQVPRLVSVGRLDLNTEGLLLLTNDGELSRYLELPETGWSRKYRVRVKGKVDPDRLKSLKSGITVDGVRYKSIEAHLDHDTGRIGSSNRWLSVTLREGKNREVRRVMEAMNLQVNRLIRVSYGPFDLGKIPTGGVVEVKEHVLKSQLAKFFRLRDDKTQG